MTIVSAINKNGIVTVNVGKATFKPTVKVPQVVRRTFPKLVENPQIKLR